MISNRNKNNGDEDLDMLVNCNEKLHTLDIFH